MKPQKRKPIEHLMNTMKTICTTASVTARRSLAALCLSLMLAQALFTPFTSAAAVPKVKTDDTSLPCEARPNFTFGPIIKKVSPSVVNIYTAKTVRENPRLSPLLDDPFFRQFFGAPDESVSRERREQALGSGVIISDDGYILTNNHVVDGADEVKVVLADGKKEFDAKVIGTDPQTDIALIKVEGKNLPAITVTDRRQAGSRRHSAGHRQSVRCRPDCHHGHRQRQRPRRDGHRGLRGFHPDRRFYQSR